MELTFHFSLVSLYMQSNMNWVLGSLKAKYRGKVLLDSDCTPLTLFIRWYQHVIAKTVITMWRIPKARTQESLTETSHCQLIRISKGTEIHEMGAS
jgi:hypothetical protein